MSDPVIKQAVAALERAIEALPSDEREARSRRLLEIAASGPQIRQGKDPLEQLQILKEMRDRRVTKR